MYSHRQDGIISDRRLRGNVIDMPSGPYALPVISLEHFETRRAVIAEQLMEAATTTGFFYVNFHGVPQELIDAAFRQAESLFSQPQEAKDTIPLSDYSSLRVCGFKSSHTTGGLVHESIALEHASHDSMQRIWPSEQMVPGFRSTTSEFMQALHPVAAKLLSCFATGLGHPTDFFDKTIDMTSEENHTFLELHKYPATEGLSWRPGTNRITAHTDVGLLTLLFPSPGSVGLEVAAGRDGKAVRGGLKGHHTVDHWRPWPQIPGTIIVNIGDPLQIWSDGRLKSNFHRVRMPLADEPQGDRYSMGLFVWPCINDKIQGRSGKQPATTMGEYFKQKGKIYEDIFSADPATYERAQKYAYGPVDVAA